MSTTKPENNKMRFDLQIIASWIEPGSRVIDLGCGEGDLLKFLIHHKGATGTGIEHNESKVTQCIEKGLSVLQGDINEEVLDYPENTFDYVILSQTLQQVYEPDALDSIHAAYRQERNCQLSQFQPLGVPTAAVVIRLCARHPTIAL